MLIFITESWLNNKILDSEIVKNSNFNLIRCDRLEGRGGGVIALLDKAFIYKEIFFDTIQNLEIIIFDILSNNNKIRFILGYRPPHSDGDTLCSLINLLSDKLTDNCIIMFDINFPNIIWNQNYAPRGSPGSVFLDFCNNYNLVQCVYSPTRENNIIDIILTSNINLINELKNTLPFLLSDYESLSFYLPFNFIPIKKTKFRNFSKGNYELINTIIDSTDWSGIFDFSCDINNLWNSFMFIINDSINSNIPLIVKSNQFKSSFLISSETKKLNNKKKFLWFNFKKFKN